jgi:hypothetical protein
VTRGGVTTGLGWRAADENGHYWMLMVSLATNFGNSATQLKDARSLALQDKLEAKDFKEKVQ